MHESEKWKWSHSCPTLSDPMDCSLPGSSIHGIFQARVLEYWSGVPLPSPRQDCQGSLQFFYNYWDFSNSPPYRLRWWAFCAPSLGPHAIIVHTGKTAFCSKVANRIQVEAGSLLGNRLHAPLKESDPNSKNKNMILLLVTPFVFWFRVSCCHSAWFHGNSERWCKISTLF